MSHAEQGLDEHAANHRGREKAQNMACAAPAGIVLILNEKNGTKASGANITTHGRGEEKLGTLRAGVVPTK